MPFPLAAAIAAGANIFGNALNASSTAKANRQNIAFQREMYSRQRADALADMHYMNAYNDPSAQMNRFRAAGINPNMVVSGGASSVSAPVRSSSPASANIQAPRFDFSGIADAIMQSVQMNKIQAETDKLRAATDFLKTQELATKVGTDLTKVKIGRAEVDLSQASKLAPVQVDQALASLEKTKADTAFTLDSNARAAVMQSYNIREALSRIATAQLQRMNISADTDLKKQSLDTNEANQAKLWQDIANGKLDAKIKEFEIMLNKRGLTRSDPAYMRAVADFINDAKKSNISQKLNYLGGSAYGNY